MISFAPDSRELASRFYPFTSTSEVADLRLGIMTIREKWANWDLKLSLNLSQIPGNFIPCSALGSMKKASLTDLKEGIHYRSLENVWQLMEWNDWAIREDFALLTKDRYSEPIPETVSVSGVNNIFIEPGAKVEHCILNAKSGPIYISSGSIIMEGACIRGPFALGKNAVVKMGARIYGATTIGDHCIAGGEIKNSIMIGFSNKAHDGYLGDSVIGRWCNLGAGTSNSNIKNSAATVKVWDNHQQGFKEAGQKCGLLMGDYSRASINTSFNTGTVVGICSNVFGAGLTPKYIPDFSWGMEEKEQYEWEKALRDIENWKKLKGEVLHEQEIQKLKAIFDRS